MRVRWTRGIAALVLLGLGTAAVLISPAGAALSRKEIKKIALKQGHKAINQYLKEPGILSFHKLGPAETPNADGAPGSSLIAFFETPPGNWAVTAKVWFHASSGNPTISCNMRVPGTTDFGPPPDTPGWDDGKLQLLPDIVGHGVITLVGAGTWNDVHTGVELTCAEENGESQYRNAHIVAVRGGAIGIAPSS